jgi:alkaline phosphatase
LRSSVLQDKKPNALRVFVSLPSAAENTYDTDEISISVTEVNGCFSCFSRYAATFSRRHGAAFLFGLLALAVSGFVADTYFHMPLAGAQPVANVLRAKNVILMIADGSGANTIAATGMYTGKLGNQIFDGLNWTKSFVSTYPLRTGNKPVAGPEGLSQDPHAVYDPAKNWDTTQVTTSRNQQPDRFAGYRWSKGTAPDSANSLVAVVTGRKTYDGAINVDGNGAKLLTIAERASKAGKSVGVVTTVPISDATPAVAGGAHNVRRGNRTEIATEMLHSGTLTVIMGTGNPDYDDDGRRRTTPNHYWISASDWTDLKAGRHASGFTLVQDKSEFDALSTATTATGKFIGIARSFNSTQFERSGAMPATEAPNTIVRRADVPSLRTMVLGALNILDNDPDGMFLMIEGGAVDRAMHSRNLGRMIEEKIEFDDAVAAVSAYLDANASGNNWSNTLVIVTADHDHMLFGPDSDTVPFQPLQDNGAGRVPGYRWQHNAHSNQLVPLFARGPGANLIPTCADQRDSYKDSQGRTFGRGAYLDQTEIFSIMSAGGRCS